MPAASSAGRTSASGRPSEQRSAWSGRTARSGHGWRCRRDGFSIIERGADAVRPWTPSASEARTRREAHDRAMTADARLATIALPDFGMPDGDAGHPGRHLPRPPRTAARTCRASAATTASSSTPTASTARTSSYLTGFDPRFEEAILVVGAERRAGHPRRQRVLRHGRRRAAADAPRPLPGPQPAGPAARPLAAAGGHPGRRGHRPPARASAWSAGRRTPAGRPSRCPPSSSTSCAAWSARPGWSRTPTTCSSTPRDGLRVINEVDQLAYLEWAACQTSRGVRDLRLRPATRA